jgi:outer membrane protein OmpA-like peptidoglycan-associated protein
MTALSEVLANNPDYLITIESHTDDRGVPEDLQDLYAETIACDRR